MALLALLRPDLLRGAWREAMGSLRGDTIGLRMAVSPRDHEGKALAAFLDAHPDFDVTTVESDTPASSMGLLRSGNADLAVLPAVLPPGGGNVERVALGSAGARLLHMLAPADSGLNSYAQLAGKRVGGGLPGSVEATLLESLFAAIPLNPPAKLVTGHNLDLEQAFLDGEIDAGAVIRPLPSPEVTGLIATGYYRLLSVSVGAAGIWSLPAAFLASIPAQVYTAPGSGTTAENPVPTLGLDMLVYTRPDLAHGVAGSLATTLAAALERNGMVGISGRNALAGLPPEVHLHPGAAAAYRSMAPWTWDDAALLTWMLCGLAVLTLLGMRALQYRETRLHRQRASLVTHFALRARALELAFAEAPDEKRDALRRELLDLDEQAEAAWLSGRLDASDILMLRLGWSAELPERSTEELRARALEIPAAASPVRPSREAAPAMLHVPTSMPPTVTPVPARDLEPDTHEDEPSDFVPEETEFARPLPRQPEAAPQATDEYGSGALLNTIRVRKRIEDDLDEPPAQPEPLPRVADAKQDASIRVKQKEPKRGPDSAKRGARKEPAARNERAPAKPPAPPRETPPQDADGGKPQLPLF